jgi:hypothetical protein
MLKLLRQLCLLILCSVSGLGQTTLSPGDLVIIGFKTAGGASSGRDIVKILPLVNLSCGTEFIVTDLNWDASSNEFRQCPGSDQEFGIRVTITSEVEAGSVIEIHVDDPVRDAPFILSGIGACTDEELGGIWGVNYGLSSGGDNAFLLQGDFFNPSFIFGLRNNGTFAAGGGCSSRDNTGLPPSLTLGSTAIQGVGANRWHYNCSVLNSGTKAALLSAISNPSNWDDISNNNWDNNNNYNSTCVFNVTDNPFPPVTGSIGVSGAGCGCLGSCNLTSLNGPNCSPSVSGDCNAGQIAMSTTIDVPAGCTYTVVATMRQWLDLGCSASGADAGDRMKVDILGGTKPLQSGSSNATLLDSYTLSGPGQIVVSGNANRADEIIAYKIYPNPCDLCDISLPVEWLDFTVKLNQNNMVDISWSTASEINNDYFTILRSGDGIDWEEVARYPGKGNSSQIHYYQLVDSSPLEGISYYKIIQTDFDGMIDESKIRSIYVTNSNDKLLHRLNTLGQEVNETFHGIQILYFESGKIMKLFHP